MIDWKHTLSILMVILIYIPLVLVAVNTFAPDTSYRAQPEFRCYDKTTPCPEPIDAETCRAMNVESQKEAQDCYEEQKVAQDEWEANKFKIEGGKLIAILIINIVALAAIAYLALAPAITTGIFVGAIITSFIATVRYFEARSKIGIILLAIIFVIMLWLINKRADGKSNKPLKPKKKR